MYETEISLMIQIRKNVRRIQEKLLLGDKSEEETPVLGVMKSQEAANGFR